MSRYSEWRKRRRKKGLCGENGCNAVSGDEYRCPACREAHCEKEKLRYWSRKSKSAAKAAA